MYEYAAGESDPPKILHLRRAVDRFGAQAVLGRQLSAEEIRSLLIADDVLDAFRSRERHRDKTGNSNWAEWAAGHKQENRLLTAIEIGLGNGSE